MHYNEVRRICAALRLCLLTGSLLTLILFDVTSSASARIIPATSLDYLELIPDLRPGDTLQLAKDTYRRGLPLRDLHGAAGVPVVITGPPDRTAVFLGRPAANTVELRNVSYVEIRNLTLDGRNMPNIDGVKSQDLTHNITLENLEIINHGANQQTVGISTKAPAWDWAIRNCIVRGAGTGLYLGNSDGSAPFVRGLIEHNLIANTIGYGLQIKHQRMRPKLAGMPTDRASTIIRYNVISKARQPARGFQGSRPNLLVGHFPLNGPGVEDTYEIYGNLLYQNLVDEPLFQGEGNIVFHDNLLINQHGDGVWIQPHNDLPKRVTILHNTIVAKGIGVAIRGANAEFEQLVVGNAIFARTPIEAASQMSNFNDDYVSASDHLKAPLGASNAIDLRPKPGQLSGAPIDLTRFTGITDVTKDFAGNPRNGTVRGAYAGSNVSRWGSLRLPSAF